MVVIGLVQRYDVVAIPGICNCFPHVFGDMMCQVEGCLHSECLMFAELV